MSSVPPSILVDDPSGGGSGARPIVAVLVVAALAAVLFLWLVGNLFFSLAFAAGLIATSGLLYLVGRGGGPAQAAEPLIRPDIALLRAALDASGAATAVTEGDSTMCAANALYSEWFGTHSAPLDLPFGPDDRKRLKEAASRGRRDGSAQLEGLSFKGMSLRAEVCRAGAGDGYLLWKFARALNVDLAWDARRLIEGEPGSRLGEAGVMAALADEEGKLITANRAFAARAFGEPEAAVTGAPLVELIGANERGQFHFVAEGKGGGGLRIVQVPVADGQSALTLFIMLDDSGGFGDFGQEGSGSLNALLDLLPLGLALANTDGRFIYLNKGFRKAAGLTKDARPLYPSDLVVEEDKGAVADSVRRFARGRPVTGDISVRLKCSPDEPVALTIAGARGLGEAAVILSLKDNSEEDRLKRQIAQATKMQAVGQLAGGVAHDFNNILTAILGYCDLMLMRHTPGDSDYDDIQQIRSNSNRAAGLTRQLLAFSRQQTLRPQVLQLPDVISEVSNLLKRLLGETVKLQVKHGRNLGAVRADPGQLEQVIVNLAVNGRDAMPEGGTLTLQTYAVSSDDVRKMASEILPIADYAALRVTDTGTGIPQALISKIFEPFFTTKEVGKGTGLGLSTVYGIVKQSGGFIFAESEPGQGASFVIYLPVHRAPAAAPPSKAKGREKVADLWGSGTVLLVEDEAMVRAVAERALVRHGYSVLTAENGEAALEILGGREKIDLMISDVVMPTMDGPTTAREARKMQPDLPILFISGYAEEQLRQSIDIERVAFLAKPFSVQKLAEAVRDALLLK